MRRSAPSAPSPLAARRRKPDARCQRTSARLLVRTSGINSSPSRMCSSGEPKPFGKHCSAIEHAFDCTVTCWSSKTQSMAAIACVLISEPGAPALQMREKSQGSWRGATRIQPPRDNQRQTRESQGLRDRDIVSPAMAPCGVSTATLSAVKYSAAVTVAPPDGASPDPLEDDASGPGTGPGRSGTSGGRRSAVRRSCAAAASTRGPISAKKARSCSRVSRASAASSGSHATALMSRISS